MRKNSKECFRVCQICAHIEKILDSDPEAKKLEALLSMRQKMNDLLKIDKYRDAEEMAYAIIQELDLLSSKIVYKTTG